MFALSWALAVSHLPLLDPNGQVVVDLDVSLRFLPVRLHILDLALRQERLKGCPLVVVVDLPLAVVVQVLQLPLPLLPLLPRFAGVKSKPVVVLEADGFGSAIVVLLCFVLGAKHVVVLCCLTVLGSLRPHV